MDSVWEQRKLEARKLLENAADWASERQANIAQPKRVSAGQSPASSARFVSPCIIEKKPNSVITSQTHRIDPFQGQTEQTLLYLSLHLIQQADVPLKMD